MKRTKNDNKGIKGIAFIVDDSDKGPKLVFRYPTTFLPNRSTSHVLERPISKQTVAPLVLNPFVSCHTAVEDDDQQSDPSSSTTSTTKGIDPFGGLDTDLLAWMFRPKKVLCNQVFELEIDGTVFVSYPIVLEGGPLRLFNVVFAITTGYTGPSVGLINSYKAVAKRLATTLLHEENRCSYVSQEVQKMFRVWDELRRVASAKMNDGGSAAVSSSASTMAPPAPSTVASTLGVAAVAALSQTSSSSTPGSVSSPSTPSTPSNSNSSSSSSSNSNNATTSASTVEWSERGAGDVKVDLHTLVDVCLSRSLLACDIKDIYHKLRQQRMAQIIVNSFIPLSLSLRDPTIHPR